MRAFSDFIVSFGGLEPQMSRFGKRQWRAAGSEMSGSSASALVANPSEARAVPLLHAHESGPWRLWLLGELFDYRGRVASDATAENVARFASDLRQGAAAPQALNGHFAMFGWDQSKNEWHTWTNRHGTFHIYHGEANGKAAIGTYYASVAEVASHRRLDWTGLTGFFSYGFFPADLTYFDDVRVLRPATHAVWDGNGRVLREERYWQWSHRPDPHRSYDDSVAEFGVTLDNILADHTRSGKMALPISGGLDSRTVAGAATQEGEKWASARSRLWTYSYGYTPYSPETRIAARVAAARHLSFDRYVVPEYLFRELDTVLASVEGYQGVASTRQAAFGREIAAHGDYLLAGHWGDVWMDEMGLVSAGSGNLTETAIVDHAIAKVAKPGCAWLLENVVKDRVDRPEAMLREITASELQRLAHIEDADFRVKAFKTEQWSFRWTVPSLRMFQPGAFPRLPFYDNRMGDFCCTVPSAFVAGRRMQIDYLKRRHPDLARITWENFDANLYWYQHYRTWLWPKRAYRKLWRMVSGQRHVGRNWEMQFFSAQGRAGLEQWLLHPGLKVHEYAAPASIRALLDDVIARPGGGNGYALSQLLTFSAWLERNL